MRLATDGWVSLFLDDVHIVHEATNTSGPLGDADAGIGEFQLSLGLQSSEGVVQQTLYYDDVVSLISSDATVSELPRIGCK